MLGSLGGKTASVKTKRNAWTKDEEEFLSTYKGYSLPKLCMVLSLFGFKRTYIEIANKSLWLSLQEDIEYERTRVYEDEGGF